MRATRFPFLLLLGACAAPQTTPAPPTSVRFADGPELRGSLDEVTRLAATRAAFVVTAARPDGAWVHSAAGLRAVFDDGVQLEDGIDAAWTGELDLVAYGRPGALASVSSPRTTEGWADTVTLHRGPVHEWYRDLGTGLEQGFTLDQAPGGRGPVALEMEVRGDLRATLASEGVQLDTIDGAPAVRVADLLVEDATGRELDAWFEVDCATGAAACHFRIAFDDADATWPVTVDPTYSSLLAERSGMAPTASNEGWDVDVSDGRAIVAAPNDFNSNGVVLILERNNQAADDWTVEATLTSNDATFGSAVAIDGSTAVVGVPGGDSAYVYERRANGTWTVQSPTLGGNADSNFGTSVDLEGDVLVVGAPDDNAIIGGTDYGAVYVYRADRTLADPWSVPAVQLLDPFATGPDAGFGTSVSVQNDLLVVGAALRGAAAANAVGQHVATFSYDRASETWNHAESFFADGLLPDTRELGASVTIAGEYAAFGYPYSGVLGEGVGTVQLWRATDQATLGAPSGTTGFGRYLAGDHTTLAVSALSEVPTAPGAQVWLYDQATLEPIEVIQVPEATTEPPRVALSGGLLAIGVPDANGGDGKVVFYRREGDFWLQTSIEPTAGSPDTGYGKAVSMEGDWLAVGQPTEDTLGVDAGQVLLLRNDGGSWTEAAVATHPSPLGGERFGQAVDLGDELLAVGAPGDDLPSSNAGSAHMFELQAGPSPTATLLYSVSGESGQAGQLGSAVHIDQTYLVAGEPYNGNGLVKAFRHQMLPQPSGVLHATWSDAGAPRNFGLRLASNGRFVAASSPVNLLNPSYRGRVSVLDLDNPAAPALHTFVGPTDGAELGQGLAFSGDFLFVGAPGADGGGYAQGGSIRAFEWNGTDFVNRATFSGADSVDARTGWSLDASGDRVIVGSDTSDRATIHARNEGGQDTWGLEYAALPVVILPGEQYGYSVAIDGARAAAGSPSYDGGTGVVTGRIVAHDLGVNTLPQANDDVVIMDEDTSATGRVLDNDFDADLSSPVSVASFTPPATGTFYDLGMVPSGLFEWAPDPDFHGDVTFTYELVDGTGPATVTLRVNSVNDLPVAVPDVEGPITEGTIGPVADTVLDNDYDVDHGPAELTAVLDSDVPAGEGTLVFQPDGTYTYELPDDDFDTSTSFSYHLVDAAGGVSNTVVAEILVFAVNDPPVVATPPSYTFDEDPVGGFSPPLGSGLLATASDVDTIFDDLEARKLTDPAEGFLTIQPDGDFTFIPNMNFNGQVVVPYEVWDGQIGTVVDLTMTINPVNDPPVGVPDYIVGLEDQPAGAYAGSVLDNDTDVEGDPITASLIAAPQNGVLNLSPDGTFDYTPNPDFAGIDTFVYRPVDPQDDGVETTVTIDITPINDPPTVTDYVAAPTDEDTPLVVSAPGLLAGAVDVDGDPISVDPVVVSQPNFGTVSLQPNGGFTYTPDPDVYGPDTFQFRVVDSVGTSGTATAILDVTPINDPPTGVADGFFLDEDSSLVSPNSLLINDTDVDDDWTNLVARKLTDPSNGTLTNFDPNGTFTYVPDPDFFGVDSFTYEAEDPAGEISNTVTVGLTVQPINDAPVAIDDSYSAVPGQNSFPAVQGLLVNDIDVDGDLLTAILVSDVSNGVLLLQADGAFDYSPDPGFIGDDSFTYEVDDGVDMSNTATVTLTVSGGTTGGTGGSGLPGDTGIPGTGTGSGTGTGTGTATGSCETTWYADSDADGYGDPDKPTVACDPPAGTVADNTDCDDSNAEVFPGAEEIAGDGVDQDCDGVDAVVQAGKGGGGCGCDGTGGSAPWLALGLTLLAVRRRRG